MPTVPQYLKIGDTDVTNLVKKMSTGLEDLYKDGNRNMAGDFKGTFIGVFRKINVTFRPLTVAEANSLATLLATNFVTVSYCGTRTNVVKTAVFNKQNLYFEPLNEITGRYGEVSLTLVANKKET